MGGSTKIAEAPTLETPKTVSATTTSADSDFARQQALKRGLASVWTRYSDSQSTDGSSSTALASKSEKLGG
jgi:hypothetical protein